ATVLKAAHTSDWRALEQITAEAWLTKWSGARAYESFWKPLLRAKLGDRHDEVSAAFIWAIMQRLYAARRANMKQDLFGYLPGGYARTLERFASVLESRGASIRTSARVETITTDGGRPVVQLADGTVSHDRIVVTLPSPVAAAIIPALDADERQRHAAIPYQGIVCPSLLLDGPLSDYYVTNITDSSSPFTGIIEMTALVDRAEFAGRSLVYLPQYVPPEDPLFAVPDQEILDQSIAALSRMYPSFDLGQVVAAAVGRARHVLPLSTVGYSQRLPPMQTSVEGVFVVNSAHIVNGTLNVNETVELVGRSLPVVTSGDRVESAP
ncbi:FAD-dependent oxidoreductase, partial [Actinomycetota bacterium]